MIKQKSRTSRGQDEWILLLELDKCITDIKSVTCSKVRGNDGFNYTSSKAVGRLAKSLRVTADNISNYSRKYTV